MALRERPNIVLFMPDQLRADALGAFGNPFAYTPTVDALAAQGTVFRQAFVQHSVCAPSRVSMMTGWYPHTAGHRSLDYLLKPWEPNKLAILRSAGYHVAWAGVRGDTFGPGVTEASTDFAGFLVWPETLHGESPHSPDAPLARAFHHGSRGDAPVLDLDEAAVRTAEQWLADGPPEPWVLVLTLLAPHPPFEVEEPWYSLHDRAAMPAPVAPGGHEPDHRVAMRQAYGLDDLSPADWAEVQATYHGMVSRVDHHLARVLAAVDLTGAGERTAVVFYADHGEYLGDYGCIEKWPSALEPCLVRNPLVVCWPGGREGQVCDEPVELVDLLPTLAELGGAEIHHTHFGRSFAPLLVDASTPHRPFACSEGGFSLLDRDRLERPVGAYERKGRLQHERPALVAKATALRTKEWAYVHRVGGRHELYDRVADPHETVNLVDVAEHAATVRSLRDAMFDWLVETSDVFPWEADPRMSPFPHGYRDAEPVT